MSDQNSPPGPNDHLPLAERRFEPRCHICRFIREEPEFGQLYEAQLLDPSYDNVEVTNQVNRKFGQIVWTDDHGNEKWEWKPDWRVIDQKKVRTHLDKHVTDFHTILRRARERGMTGNITLEKNVMNMLTISDALLEAGTMKVMTGDIQINSLNDLLKVMEIQHKFLGADKVEIKIGGGGGLNIPPQFLQMMFTVMAEFVDPHRQQEFRMKLDEMVFPEFVKYAEQWEAEHGRPIDQVGALPSPEGREDDIEGDAR
jgi:hypothetical protein